MTRNCPDCGSDHIRVRIQSAYGIYKLTCTDCKEFEYFQDLDDLRRGWPDNGGRTARA